MNPKRNDAPKPLTTRTLTKHVIVRKRGAAAVRTGVRAGFKGVDGLS